MVSPTIPSHHTCQNVHFKQVVAPQFGALLTTLGYKQSEIKIPCFLFWKHPTYDYEVEVRLSTSYWTLSKQGRELKVGSGFRSFSETFMNLHQMSLFS